MSARHVASVAVHRRPLSLGTRSPFRLAALRGLHLEECLKWLADAFRMTQSDLTSSSMRIFVHKPPVTSPGPHRTYFFIPLHLRSKNGGVC